MEESYIKDNIKTYYILNCLLFFAWVFCAGCGETVEGMGQDAHRIGKGVKTIFVSEE